MISISVRQDEAMIRVDSDEVLTEALVLVRSLYDSIKGHSPTHAAMLKHKIMQERFWSDEHKGVIQDA